MPDSKLNTTAFLNAAGTIYAARNDGLIDSPTAQDVLLELTTSVAEDITGVSSASKAPPPDKPILVRMEWGELSDTRCRDLTRFRKTDIERMITVMQLPTPFFRTKSRSKVPIQIALSMILARLSAPHRLVDVEDIFGYVREIISETFNQLGGSIFDQWAKPLLTSWNDTLLTPSRLELYASTIHSAGAPMYNLWGFIDVTYFIICRPGKYQEVNYTGYKHAHAPKFNAVTTPDGLIAHCSLPVEGRRADAGVLAVSEFEKQMEAKAFGHRRRRLFAYSDPAYGLTNTIISASKKLPNLPTSTQLLYTRLPKSRVSVEWAFGKSKNLFGFLDYPRSQRLHLSPIGKWFLLGILFTNLHTCIYSSVTSSFFCLNPPSLEEYLQRAHFIPI